MKKELVEIFDSLTGNFVATDISLIYNSTGNDNYTFPQNNVKTIINNLLEQNHTPIKTYPQIPTLNTEYKAEIISSSIYNNLIELENSFNYISTLTNRPAETDLINELKIRIRSLIDNQISIHKLLQRSSNEDYNPNKINRTKNFNYEIIKCINTADKILMDLLELQTMVNIPDLNRLFTIQNAFIQNIISILLLIMIIK